MQNDTEKLEQNTSWEKESAIVSLVAIAQTGDPKEVLETAITTVVDAYTTRTLASHNNSLVERLEGLKGKTKHEGHGNILNGVCTGCSFSGREAVLTQEEIDILFVRNEVITEAQELIKNSLT